MYLQSDTFFTLAAVAVQNPNFVKSRLGKRIVHKTPNREAKTQKHIKCLFWFS